MSKTSKADDATDDAPNEIMAAARAVKQQGEAAAKAVATTTKGWPLARIGLAAGLGSAALAGAVLCSGRTRARKCPLAP